MSTDYANNNDEISCKTIASSISEIIRFSLDEKFRKSCFELFGTSSIKQTEDEINNKLMSLIENENKLPTSKKPRKNKKKSKEMVKECNNTVDWNKITEQQSSNRMNAETHTVSQCNFQKSWLQISSQQYRDAIKRQKLNYYSQPLATCAYQNDFQVTSNNLRFTQSQPVSNISSQSLENYLTSLH